MLIGLMGSAGAGKDEVARILVEDFGYTRVAFADKLKEIARAIGWDGNKDDAGRTLLQNLGVAVRDHLHPDAWVNAVDIAYPRVVISDVRFANEIALIRRQGELWRVDRPGVDACNDHVSEHEWRRAIPDVIVENAGTLDALRLAVKRAML